MDNLSLNLEYKLEDILIFNLFDPTCYHLKLESSPLKMDHLFNLLINMLKAINESDKSDLMKVIKFIQRFTDYIACLSSNTIT